MKRRKKSRRGSNNKRNGKVTFDKQFYLPDDDENKSRSIDSSIDTIQRILEGRHGPEITLDKIAMMATETGIQKENLLEFAKALSSGVIDLPDQYSDSIYAERHEKTRRCVVGPVDKYLEICSIDARNVNVIGDYVNDGDPIRLNSPSENGTSINQELAFFIQTVRAAKIFAFPTWWFDAAIRLWRVKLFRNFTEDWDDPFTGEDIVDLTQWMKTNITIDNKDRNSEIFDKNWAHNASIGKPENMPFSTMFVGFERDQSRHRLNNGHLVYQRIDDQGRLTNEMGIPTKAYAPDRDEPVPLDFIYLDGILWDLSYDRWTFAGTGSRKIEDAGLIWAICTGYVISDPYCPADRSYLRIPMAVPIFCNSAKGRKIFDAEFLKDAGSHRPPTSWISPNSYLPGPLSSIIIAIDEHRVVQSSFNLSQRKKRNKANRNNKERTDMDGLEITHKNYLRVQMSSSSKPAIPKLPTDGSLSGLIKKWTLTSRVSIRSHERVKIYRGLKPMRDEDKDRLIRLGYTIYNSKDDITRKDHQRLKLRGSEGADITHWVALKAIRVKEHERGPENAPLIKVVRVADTNTVTGSLRDDLSHKGPIV